MIQMLFDYPLPNNGDRYDLSQKELVELLQKAYDNGAQSMPPYTHTWVGLICPNCQSGIVTSVIRPGLVPTRHCSSCGHSWEV